MRRGYGLIIALALIVTACASGPSPEAIERDQAPPSTTTTTLPPEGVVIVRINNGTFKPALLQISLENQWIVRWVNEDTREYVVAMRDQFESPTLAQGDSFEFNFRDLEPALYRYYTFSGNQRIPGQVDTRPQS